MAELKNELTWSITRNQSFHGCPRAYYYNYYGSWGGWSPRADEKTRLTYLLKNIKTLILWAGTIVHDTIKDSLTMYQYQQVRPTLESLQNAAVLKMRNGWVESIHQQWLENPKATNLFELYYGNGEEYGTCKKLPREVTDAIKQRVLDCMEGFFYTPIAKDFFALPVSSWQPVDTLDSFVVGDIKVWCAPDFAFTDQEGIFHIIDWKTGGENRTTITQQLACYAMFAVQKWNIPLEKIRIHGVFLKDGGRVQNYELKESFLETTTKLIQESFAAMKGKLSDLENNVAREEDFPPQPSEFQCRNCPFRRLCLEC